MQYWSKAARKLSELVELEAEKLRSAGFEELAAMAPGGEDVEIMGRAARIFKFVERPDNSSVKIILQGSVPLRWRILGSHFHVVGFQKNRDGVCKELDDRDLNPYS